jgi:hypothetical protein
MTVICVANRTGKVFANQKPDIVNNWLLAAAVSCCRLAAHQRRRSSPLRLCFDLTMVTL